MNILKRMASYCEEHELIQKNDRIVVAVSGGPDSVALLHLLKRWSVNVSLDIVVAHANHQLRPGEADVEEEGVRKLAFQWGLPFEATKLDVIGAVKKQGLNVQDAARRLRYAWLEQVARKHRAQKIAVAHHADDQAETVLMRILRGSGSDGLEGIPVRRRLGKFEIIRPLLWCEKNELMAYCHHHALPYFIDSSNTNRKYLRNALRQDVIPALEKINPQFKQNLVHLSEMMLAENAYMDKEVSNCLAEVAEQINDQSWKLKRDALIERPVALQRRVIKLILSYLFVKEAADFRKIELIRKTIRQTSRSNLRLDLGNYIQLIKEYDSVILAKIDPDNQKVHVTYRVQQCPGQVVLKEQSMLFTVSESYERDINLLSNEWHAVFDHDLVHFPLILRNRKAGDRIRLPGLEGRKKVKDVLIDAKVPPSKRDNLVLVEDAKGNILWIGGIRKSAVANVTERTSNFLHMTLRKINVDTIST